MAAWLSPPLSQLNKLKRRARCHYKSHGQWAKPMTEFQFLENLEFYQRRFEQLHQRIIRDMSLYIRKNQVHDSVFFKTILQFSVNITLTAAWIKLLKDFNADKYSKVLRFSPEFNRINGVPGANINPSGNGNNK
jgi:hypothetical protein